MDILARFISAIITFMISWIIVGICLTRSDDTTEDAVWGFFVTLIAFGLSIMAYLAYVPLMLTIDMIVLSVFVLGGTYFLLVGGKNK